MAEPFLSEIRVFSFAFAPRGWAFCNGQTLAINQNQALFALLGTTYGGNGTTTFKLPNLQGNVGVSSGSSPTGTPYPLGQVGGSETVALTNSQIPSHSHTLVATTSTATTNIPTNAGLAVPNVNPRLQNLYGTTGNVAMAPQSIGNSGGGQPHTNDQPLLVLNFCIALQGIFPSRD